MLTLRLSRIGKRKQPSFRLICVEKQKDPWGTHVEILGTMNPRSKEQSFNAERIKYWLSVGAQPSDTVRNLLITHKIIEGKKANVTRLTKKRQAAIAAKVKPAEAPAT